MPPTHQILQQNAFTHVVVTLFKVKPKKKLQHKRTQLSDKAANREAFKHKI
jgi:hypothetical protein